MEYERIDRRKPPEDYYCGRSVGTSVTDSVAWAAQWALDWMKEHAPENAGIITALEDSLNAYDKNK